MASVSDSRPIENLIAEYAERLDSADLAGVGALFAEGAFIGTDGTRYEGSAAVEGMLRDRTIVHSDGTLRTHHVTTNIRIDIDEEACTATGRAYLTLFQAADGLPLQPIAAGRYNDRYVWRDGTWRFAERRINVHLVGDTSYHMS
ncbi:nuclear transport factor 2 family protein [Streptomyces sp. NRRL S-340]|uniref:nuclear transport factor 2 family protein n=1 Tax=Streptomyces sp. NRRL S-340 TaxID=1463901 RepID=UPI000562C1CE|nr:nuclear transport factor 2 family protein [Streptomyces sp. NRRL S-340]